MALASTACFMIHSMLFFWHRYELPAVAHGLVTIDNPRMGTTTRTTEAESSIMVPLLQEDLNQQQQQQHGSQQHRLHLPPRNSPFMRGQSHPSMSSLGRNSTSRQSSTGIPFQGDGDDDGSESYMYFMNGEVCYCCVVGMRTLLLVLTCSHTPITLFSAGCHASGTKRERAITFYIDTWILGAQ